MEQTYQEEDTGRTLNLHVREAFDVFLGESRMGGYRWRMVEDGSPVLQAQELPAPPASVTIPGTRNSRSWRFTALQPGSTQLRLQHVRSWQPENPGREFCLNVSVSA